MTTAALILALFAAGADGASAPKVTLLDFHSKGCEPCRQMRPEVARLVDGKYRVRSIDTEGEPAIAARYRITAVPAFVLVDSSGREIDRKIGACPAIELATLYNEGVRRVAEERPAADRDDAAPASPPEKGESPARSAIPRPWETSVRIQISEPPFIEFGSGTIISSDEDETVILTCAHIFKSRSGAQIPPSKFHLPIKVDLFDGQLRKSRPGPGLVLYANESFRGEAIDYDFATDVGLIRFRPGRRLAASPVVPASWRPRPGLDMDTVGCAGGKDATAWSTQISRFEEPMRSGGKPYHAIECVHAPLQGRSGGGLFTKDGYLAGVCDFADYGNDRGLYAAPTSIYTLLDRNRLRSCYAPAAGDSSPRGGLLADASAKPRPGRATTSRSEDITMPSPDVLGASIPARGQSADRSGVAWKSGNPSRVVGGVSLAQGASPARSQARLQNPDDRDEAPPARGANAVDMRVAESEESAFDPLGLPDARPSDRLPTPRDRSSAAWKVVRDPGLSSPSGR